MRYITIGFALSLVTASAWAGTFIDDFEDGDLDSWRQVNPVTPMLWKTVDGELECVKQNSESTVIVIGEDDWSDYTIDFDVMLLEDFGQGDVDIVARYIDPMWSNLIMFWFGDCIGPPEVNVVRYPGGVRTRKPFAPLELDEWYHIKLEAEGDDFSLWLNDEKILDHTDKALKSGSIGLGLANYSARFDNVVVAGPEVPDVVPLTWKSQLVESRSKLTTTWASIKM